jgi:DNA-binding MarR family transcriptional regulator
MTQPNEQHLPVLPCACANIRRTARAVTRIYNHELQATGLELTQFTLLMTLTITGEITQGRLGAILVLDSTSLTRMLKPLIKHGWISVKAGKDRRQKLLQLTQSGREKYEQARPDWQRAQKRLQQSLGDPIWNNMGALLTEVANVQV